MSSIPQNTESEQHLEVDKKQTENQICPKCGKEMFEKNGKFGKFLGCTGFPNCRYTKSL